ncbi:TetR/AcrR family transcriptional regulator [Nocardia crassostreae]|uniref:TetR/AcrR family transcriptional regulator n=1 Tax=Nocardia crassostreae TaxID=53428 RepID=UPI000A01536B|nr:TetR-like C-terminal domain-containing protein [Nocardia crassostreae]
MAVYTYFGSIDGLWQAVRQEGSTRLAARLRTVEQSRDAVRDLTALGAAYVVNALANPDLYRVMFDATADLEDATAADETLHTLVIAIERAKADKRFRADTDPVQLATQSWIIGHGLTALVATGPLPRETLAQAVPMLTALYVAAGDEPRRCHTSVRDGWQAALE